MQSWGIRGNTLHANFHYAVNFWFERGKEKRLLIKKVQSTSRFSLISRVAEPLLCCIIQMCGVSSRLGSQRWRVRIPLLAKNSKCFRHVKTFSIFNTSITSEMESSLAYSDKSAIGRDISRYSNSSFSKTTALNSVKVWIDEFLLSTMSPSPFLIIFSKLGPLDLLYFWRTVMFKGEEKLQQNFLWGN